MKQKNDNYILFSIVIPAYNSAKSICTTLNSVCAQTFLNYEIIVVDDGSSDNTYKLVKNWSNKNPFIKLKLIHQENKGIGGARNTGIKNSSGEFIAFLDSDDTWIKNKLETVKSILDIYDDIDFICHDVNTVQKDKSITPFRVGPASTFGELLFNGNCIATSAVIVRKSKLLLVNMFSEDLKYNSAEDYELWLKLFKIKVKVYYIHKLLSYYFLSNEGISSRVSYHSERILNVIRDHYKHWDEKKFTIFFFIIKN